MVTSKLNSKKAYVQNSYRIVLYTAFCRYDTMLDIILPIWLRTGSNPDINWFRMNMVKVVPDNLPPPPRSPSLVLNYVQLLRETRAIYLFLAYLFQSVCPVVLSSFRNVMGEM